MTRKKNFYSALSDYKSLNMYKGTSSEGPIMMNNDESLEKLLKLEKEEIYKKFFSKKYYCYMTGFIAGMPFLGDLSDSLYARRLDTPRVKVPKNSIGLTEQFCNIYTFESPGGWNIIGKTPLDIFDNKNNTSPNLINPGDTISFFQISKSEFEKKYG